MKTLSTPRRCIARHLLAPFTCALMAGTAVAADVTYERLVNPEPQNWLTIHHDYTGQRYSGARHHQQGQRQKPKTRFRGRARRHLEQREPGSHAAG